MLVSAIYQHESAIGMHTKSLPSRTSLLSPTPSYPSRLSQCTSLEFCIMQQISTGYLTLYIGMYIFPCFSQFVPTSPSSTVSTSQFSMSASLLLPCREFHQYYLSRFYIYALEYNICFSLYDSLSIVSSRFICIIRTESTVFLIMAK